MQKLGVGLCIVLMLGKERNSIARIVLNHTHYLLKCCLLAAETYISESVAVRLSRVVLSTMFSKVVSQLGIAGSFLILLTIILYCSSLYEEG